MERKYRVALDAGHGGRDSGAVKYIVEKDINLKVALACRNYLEKKGVTVYMSRTTDKYTNLNKVCTDINKWGADLAVSIHNNAGGGDGFEAWYSVVGSESKKLAKAIETEIKKIGQNSRGVKSKTLSNGQDYYGFIRQTNCPAVIAECVFVDTKKDAMQIDEKSEQHAFGVAIAKGILKTLGVSNTSTVKPQSKPHIDVVRDFKVQTIVDNLNIRKSPEIKDNVVGVAKRGVYTIIKTTKDGSWGYLKSKAGWIRILPQYAKRI